MRQVSYIMWLIRYFIYIIQSSLKGTHIVEKKVMDDLGTW